MKACCHWPTTVREPYHTSHGQYSTIAIRSLHGVAVFIGYRDTCSSLARALELLQSAVSANEVEALEGTPLMHDIKTVNIIGGPGQYVGCPTSKDGGRALACPFGLQPLWQRSGGALGVG